MGKGLVIVESPAKAKTIKGFLGKDFDVQSCYGHIRDLPKDELGVDVDNGFAPKYIIPKDKKKIITNLRASLKGVETVWLATDEDREGEAISWHLVEALKLDKSKVKRIVFHEITKKAIQKAVENPRELNDDLVLAQQARRVLDRLVGYKLSPLLWKKVQSKLSAGRVQSVAVKLIVERERAHESFVPESSFKVVGDFSVDNRQDVRSFTAELKSKQSSEEKAMMLLEKLKGAVYEVKKLDVKPGKRSPSAPFTTSTLQQEAGRKLGISVKQTMRIAQQLYEEGKITYMRTDSVNLSDQAIEESKAQILKDFGHEYCNPRQYQTKSKGAQEAHEAIRPTSMSLRSLPAKGGAGSKLYELIWKRTIASQMSEAELERTVVTISAGNIEEDFIARGEVLKFDGFLKVYMDADMEDEPKQGVLPALNMGEEMSVNEIRAVQGFTKSPAR
ncbi:MAG: type I DNA topoisomerase, partial [Flavobacteriales bacterium]